MNSVYSKPPCGSGLARESGIANANEYLTKCGLQVHKAPDQ